MNRDEIIATMVKGRECCRQIVRMYESVREDGQMTKGALMTQRTSLAKANLALTQMLGQMKHLPEKPVNHMVGEDDKRYVTSLFAEISALLERAMILEREVRSSTPAEAVATGNGYGARCMKAYGG